MNSSNLLFAIGLIVVVLVVFKLFPQSRNLSNVASDEDVKGFRIGLQKLDEEIDEALEDEEGGIGITEGVEVENTKVSDEISRLTEETPPVGLGEDSEVGQLPISKSKERSTIKFPDI